jgi:3-hydroxybutyryl-CoA dehydrogenase
LEIKKIGVVGFGTMGAGIALLCARFNYHVIVSDVEQKYLEKGWNRVNSELSRDIEKGRATQKDKEAIMGRIKRTTAISDFYECDIVIEAAVEDMDTKKKILVQLDKACPPHTLLATNTSCLSVTDLAVATQRPDKVLGLHFFNPASMMALLEVVRTIISGEETINTGAAFGKSLGKTTVIVKDEPGFLVNRILMPFILNAIKMLENGLASRDDIDQAIRLGLNHSIGPLALADLIGLDVVYSIVSTLYQDYKDTQYMAPVLLKKMCAVGWLGRKTGHGFYTYK